MLTEVTMKTIQIFPSLFFILASNYAVADSCPALMPRFELSVIEAADYSGPVGYEYRGGGLNDSADYAATETRWGALSGTVMFSRVQGARTTFGNFAVPQGRMNNAGTTAGFAVSDLSVSPPILNPTLFHAFGPVTELDFLTGLGANQGRQGTFLGINDSGVAVGFYETAPFVPGETTPASAFVYQGGKVITLPGLGGIRSLAHDINENGLIAGESLNTSGENRAVLWDNQQIINLGTLPGYDSEAVALNDNGTAVGYTSPSTAPGKALMFKNGEVIDLGFVPSEYPIEKVRAFEVNNCEQVLGIQYTDSFMPGSLCSTHFPVFHLGSTMQALQNLIVTDQTVTLCYPRGLNNAGQILVEGELDVPFSSSAYSLFLLTPVNAADVNHDGVVDTADLGLLISCFKSEEASCQRQDINLDGVIDTADLGALLSQMNL